MPSLFSLLGCRFLCTMRRNYESCIEALNNLQSNANYIRSKLNSENNHNGDQLIQVRKYLQRVGLNMATLDTLSVIHVTGTKGKGTTCALSERILREHGYKTGFFSSPHLMEVRERIRINGAPIEKEKFVKYFNRVYTALDASKSDEHDMPLYFRFLTIMAFLVFLEEKVDVAIIEVGIGGEFDCTNVLRKVPVVGITSLGVDHVTLLGSTIEEIAWHKAGIMKENCRAFTVAQPDSALEVLKSRSVEKKCKLEVVEDLHFDVRQSSCPSHIFNLNASLSVALCEAWLANNNNNNLPHVLSKNITEKALLHCCWPGRFQIIERKIINYYLDGAHTYESIAVCSDWFKTMTRSSSYKRALMFNVTGGRNAENLLRQLQDCKFNTVVFVTNLASIDKARSNSDNAYFDSINEMVERCNSHMELWHKLEDPTIGKAEICTVIPTIKEAIDFLTSQDRYDLLVTGSLQLVGSALGVIG